jgi:hypothetical protein
MKIFKTALIAAAILIGANVSAQNSPVTFGVRGGLNLSNYWGDVENSKAKIGFNVGVTMDYAFSPALYLMTGLELTTKGAKGEMIENGVKLSVTENPMYLQLPVHLGYKIDIAPDTRFVLHAGPYVAYGVGGKSKITTKVEGLNLDVSTDLFSGDISYDRFDFGVGLGFGVEFGRISAGLGYDLGLANLTGNSNYKVRNMNAALTFGYRF